MSTRQLQVGDWIKYWNGTQLRISEINFVSDVGYNRVYYTFDSDMVPPDKVLDYRPMKQAPIEKH
jgi:hypothetical protein